MRFASARAILTLIIGSTLQALQNWLLAGTTRLSAGFDDRQTPIGTMRPIISFSLLRLPIKDKPPRPRWPRRRASSWNRPSQSVGIAKVRLRTMQPTWRNANDSTRECASRGYRRADVGRAEDAQTRCRDGRLNHRNSTGDAAPPKNYKSNRIISPTARAPAPAVMKSLAASKAAGSIPVHPPPPCSVVGIDDPQRRRTSDVPSAPVGVSQSCQLRRANAIQELLDLVPEVGAHVREFSCGFQHQARCRSGFAGIFCNALDVIGDIERTAGGSLDTFGDASGSGALLLDRGGNRRGDSADTLDRQSDRLDSADGFAGGALHVDNVCADLVGGFCSLACEILDLLRHHGKSTARIASPGGLDGCVKREEVGLFRNRCDQLHHVTDPIARRRQFLHSLIGGVGLLDRIGGDAVRLLNPAAYFNDRLG